MLEVGAGTGVVSRALLEGGVPPEQLIVVEIVREMAAHLRHVLPGVQVIEGDARELPAWFRCAGRGGSAAWYAAFHWCCCRWLSSGG